MNHLFKPLSTYLLSMLAIVLVGSIIASCSGGGAGQPVGIVTKRTVTPYFQGNGDYEYSQGRYTAAVPFTLSACIGYGCERPGRDDDQFECITRIEIDFGDGSNWQDVTNHRLLWDYLDASTWVQHTYTTPGEYDPTVRITYWDGEVVYQHPDLAKHVTVTAPAE